jgi:hypothetical protein
MNLQPWCAVVVDEESKKKQLFDASLNQKIILVTFHQTKHERKLQSQLYLQQMEMLYKINKK